MTTSFLLFSLAIAVGFGALGSFIASKKGTILLSTGMSSWDEIQKITTKVNDLAIPAVLMQCNSKYPTPLEKVGLNIDDPFGMRADLKTK